MKLLTHNLLRSPVKGAKMDSALKLEATQIETNEVDFNQEFVINIVPKLEWSVLYTAVDSIGVENKLPKELPENYADNEEFLQNLHHILSEIEIIEGDLICVDSGRKFPIKNGIPNMLLTEDEI